MTAAQVGQWSGAAPRVGFVGLGDQGGPIAMRIAQSDFPLTVWARRAEAMAPYVAAGAAAANDLASLGAQSDVVGICVVDDRGVIEVFETLAPQLKPGSVVLIHSTVNPETCRRLAAAGAERGITVLDAPVSGGNAAAAAGALTVMVGGSQAAFDACRPVIETFARVIIRLGDVGAGQLAKLINNALLCANLTLVDDATRLGDALGVDRGMLQQILATSSGGSMAQRLYETLGDDISSFHWATRLLHKDVGLLDEAARPDASVFADKITQTGRQFLDRVDTAHAKSSQN